MSLRNYQHRVAVEKKDLDRKIFDLQFFLNESAYNDCPVPVDDLVRLRAQLEAMHLYSEALAERLRHF